MSAVTAPTPQHSLPVPPAVQAPAQDGRPANPLKDCTACRLTGAATGVGVGSYALYQAHLQGAFARTRPVGAPIVGGKVSAAIGVIMIGLGIGRLFV